MCNNNRKSLKDERSWQPEWLAQFSDEIKRLEPVIKKQIPVATWLENVGSAEPDVLQCYNGLLNASRIRLRASEFGYTRRDRCFWGNVDGKPLSDCHWAAPECFTVDRQNGAEATVRYTGPKPIPSSISVSGGSGCRWTRRRW